MIFKSTRLRLKIVVLFLCVTTIKLQAQTGVAINTTGASADGSAILDLTNSISKGLLLPKVTTLPAAAAAPAKGLVVYLDVANSTAGIYCNTGTSAAPVWILLSSSTGTVTSFSSGNLNPLFTTSVTNPNTTPALSFTLSNANAASVFGNFTTVSAVPSYNVATIDGQFLVRRSGGLSFGTILATDLPSLVGSYIQNQAAVSQSANYYISGPASIGVANSASTQLNIATTNAANYALVATNAAASGAGSGSGIEGITNQSGGYGVWGVNNNTNGAGVVGSILAIAGSGTGIGVLGSSNQSSGYGVYGTNSSITGFSLLGYNSAATGNGSADGVYGQTAQSGGFGTVGFNTNNTSSTVGGTGVGGAGNNLALSYLTAGSGGAFTGSTTGVYALANAAGFTLTQAIYANNFGNIVRIGYYNNAGTFYKIIGAGTVSTVADNIDNSGKVVLHAPEAPEIYFEDYGEGKLINGIAHINIDPLITKNVTINNKHPLRVFIQLNGDCNGVYVTNKTSNSFDVIELQKGSSNVSFEWHIVCNRADEKLANGNMSHNADVRFEPAPADELTFSLKIPTKRITTTSHSVSKP